VVKKLVLVWLDAFSDRYLTPDLCPFLLSWSKDCLVARISPLFAYRGIGYCFETGVSINELKVWNDHVFAGFEAGAGLRYSLIRPLAQFFDKVSFNDGLNKALRFALFKILRVDYGIPHLIPANLLHFFPVPKNNFNRETLFEVLKKNNVRYIRKEPKLSRSEPSLVRKIPDLLETYDFVFLKLNSLDRIGHKYGPLSQEVRRQVKKFDDLLKELVSRLDEDTVLIIMSDHGMVPTFRAHDLIGFLNDRGYQYGRHYMAFVGATYTSFWFNDKEIKQAVEEDLHALEFGRILTFDDKTKLGLDSLGAEYGETIFVNNEHNISFPEFYHRRKFPAGMHGYAFGEYDSSIFLLHNNNLGRGRNIGNINFVDIMPTILQLFDLPIPSYVKGRAIS
jgi:predicted AlkP superfamily pyrophosphatase or phosphodiesterase